MAMAIDKRQVKHLARQLGLNNRQCIVEDCKRKPLTAFVTMCDRHVNSKAIAVGKGDCALCAEDTSTIGLTFCPSCTASMMKSMGQHRKRKRTLNRAKVIRVDRATGRVGKW